MKKDKNSDVVIDGNIVERIVDLCERSVERMEEKEDDKKRSYYKHEGFIDEQVNRIKEMMKNEDPTTDRYYKLTTALDRLLNIVRYW